METEFQSAVGKGMGEVVRDISEFLSYPCVVHPEKQIDLCTLIEGLNMAEQFSFALLSEALAQGWEQDAAERFYLHAVSMSVNREVSENMIAAFRDKTGAQYRIYEQKYGNRFTIGDGSYWSTALALGIDAGQVGTVLYYLKLFTVCLMEFAYMEDKNPSSTYTWNYYESFRAILDELTAPPEADPLPLKVRALGGTAGKREGESYMLSLGLDIENPNPDRMARKVMLDITLKDRDGQVIATVKDQIQSIDPGTVYHYGVTRRIRGAAVAGFSAKVSSESWLKLSTPIMKHVKLSSLRIVKGEHELKIAGEVKSQYDRDLRSITLHYQLLSAQNKILGGGSEWLMSGLGANGTQNVTTRIPVSVQGVAKAVYSVDFDAMELVD